MRVCLYCVNRVFTTVLKTLGTNFSPSRSNVLPADVKKVNRCHFVLFINSLYPLLL